MRVLTVFAALGLTFGGLSLLFADRADAAYSDGGPIVLGNFSQGAYGSGVDHRDAPREEPRRSVRTAALAPTAYAPKAVTTVPKSVTAPRKEEEGPPPTPPPRSLSDEQEQALLIEKSLIAVAYAKRKQETNPLWTCLHESGKQLLAHIEAEFGRGLFNVVQNVVPSEVYLHSDVLWDNGASLEDVAAYLKDYRYRQNIGPYVPVSAIEQDMLDQKEFSAVFATSYLQTLASTDTSTFGETTFTDGDPCGSPQIPP
jgi:hypothetical protein